MTMKRFEAESILDSLHEQNLLGEAYNQVEEIHFNLETNLYMVRVSHDSRPFHAERIVRLDNFYVQESLEIPYCASDFPVVVYKRLQMPELDILSMDKLEELCEEFPELDAQLKGGLDIIDALAMALRSFK